MMLRRTRAGWSHWPGLVGLVTLLGMGAAVLQGQASAEEPCAPALREPVRVAEIVDGETLGLDQGGVVRLAGIDVPESAADSLDPDRRIAEQARARLSELVAGGSVMLGPELAVDRHGRARALVYLDDARLVQAVLLAEGLARVRRFPGEDACLSTLLAAERQALAGTLGLWAMPEYGVKMANDPSLRHQIGLYELVEGRVISVGVRSSMVFLNFGREWQRDFTVMIAKPLAARFAEGGTPVEMLAKRRVRVRGVVEESGGPVIRIGDPSDIELLDD